MRKSIILLAGVGLLSLFVFSGCGKKHPAGDGHDVEKAPQEKSDSGGHEAHNHGAEGAGASFAEGKGISLMEETKTALGLELAEVGTKTLSPRVLLTAQVYRSANESTRQNGRERSGHAYATALLDPETAKSLKVGQAFEFKTLTSGDAPHQGKVWRLVDIQLSVIGKMEVLLELPDPDKSLTVGAFLEVSLPLGKSVDVVAVPLSAVLETTQGRFIYVQNGTFLIRTEIKTGGRDGDSVEITDGLYDGDTIAVKPVEALYMIELRATKGGGHCH